MMTDPERRGFPPRVLWRQSGGMLSLLATLLVLGLLAYFALRSYNGMQPASGSAAPGAPPMACTQRIADLVQRTGGLGPDYKAGYDALPRDCQKLTPPPAATSGPGDADHQ
jgi:hypothetical protein